MPPPSQTGLADKDTGYKGNSLSIRAKIKNPLPLIARL